MSLPSAWALSSRRMILPERVLGSLSRNSISSGRAIGPISLRDPVLQLLLQGIGGGEPDLQRHVGLGHVALDLVRHADDRGLSHGRVRDQRALDLSRAQPVPGHVQHFVGPAPEPEVAVRVLGAGVAGQVLAREP